LTAAPVEAGLTANLPGWRRDGLGRSVARQGSPEREQRPGAVLDGIDRPAPVADCRVHVGSAVGEDRLEGRPVDSDRKTPPPPPGFFFFFPQVQGGMSPVDEEQDLRVGMAKPISIALTFPWFWRRWMVRQPEREGPISPFRRSSRRRSTRPSRFLGVPEPPRAPRAGFFGPLVVGLYTMLRREDFPVIDGPPERAPTCKNTWPTPTAGPAERIANPADQARGAPVPSPKGRAGGQGSRQQLPLGLKAGVDGPATSVSSPEDRRRPPARTHLGEAAQREPVPTRGDPTEELASNRFFAPGEGLVLHSALIGTDFHSVFRARESDEVDRSSPGTEAGVFSGAGRPQLAQRPIASSTGPEQNEVGDADEEMEPGFRGPLRFSTVSSAAASAAHIGTGDRPAKRDSYSRRAEDTSWPVARPPVRRRTRVFSSPIQMEGEWGGRAEGAVRRQRSAGGRSALKE